MGSMTRMYKRNAMKRRNGNNKIREPWHEMARRSLMSGLKGKALARVMFVLKLADSERGQAKEKAMIRAYGIIGKERRKAL